MAKFASSGSLKDRVKLVRRISVQGEWGLEESTEVILEFYCQLRSRRLTEVEKNIGTVLEDTITVVMRHQPALVVENEMFLVSLGQEYEIITHNKDVESKRFDTLTVKRKS